MKIYIYNGKTTLEEADEDQSDFVDEINNFTKKTKPRNNEKENKKKQLLRKTCVIFTMQEKWFLMVLEAKHF